MNWLAYYLPPEWFTKLPILRDMIDPVKVNYIIWPLFQIAVLLAVVMTVVAYLTYAERKVSAWIQARLGPNRVGPRGLLQPLADGLKLLIKEDLIPLQADRIVFSLAPVISMASALVILAVIPWGAKWAGISDINIGILFVLSISSVGILGIILGGWASNSKYSLLGALRSAAQMVSYEVAMGLALIGGLLFTKTLSMQGMIDAQQQMHLWIVFFQPAAFLIYFISGIAETNRAPFDFPEAESELVAGFHTEYSGFRFSIFFIAEYTNMLVVSAVAVTMFLGGWYLPFLGRILNPAGTPFVIASILVFMGKTLMVLYCFFWFRWTFPRYRYDQLMALGWKWLIPASIANIIITATMIVIGQSLGLVFTQNNQLVFTKLGYLYFIVTGSIITIPIIWIILGAINIRSRDFNLREPQPLPMNRKVGKAG